MPSYKCVDPILYKDKLHAPESSIELSEGDAAQLLELGSIIALDGGGEAPKKQAPTDEAERMFAIRDAISGLNLDLADNWTKSGIPQISAIEAVTGWPVSAKERDEVWVAMKSAAPVQTAAADNGLSANASAEGQA